MPKKQNYLQDAITPQKGILCQFYIAVDLTHGEKLYVKKYGDIAL
jgi:hypothetical protein